MLTLQYDVSGVAAAKTIFVFGTGPVPMPTEMTDGKSRRMVLCTIVKFVPSQLNGSQTFFDTGPVPTEKTSKSRRIHARQPAAEFF